jgi:hypothetical protein
MPLICLTAAGWSKGLSLPALEVSCVWKPDAGIWVHPAAAEGQGLPARAARIQAPAALHAGQPEQPAHLRIECMQPEASCGEPSLVQVAPCLQVGSALQLLAWPML